MTRRQALQGLGLAGIGAFVSACGGNGTSGSATATSAPAATSTPVPPSSATPVRSATATVMPTETSTPTGAASATATASPTGTPSNAPTATPTGTVVTPACILSPEQTQGPYFLDLNLLRSDIREDREGTLLRLVLQLVEVDGCTPIRDALVNIWHADASGAYSGFAGQPGGVDTTGETFLRGYQVTDANGQVEFTTIYPGWYTGRTVHIHFMARLDASSLITTQLYFDESLTDAVYAQAPYDIRGEPDTTNETDGVIRTGGVTSLDEVILDVVPDGAGYTGSLVIGVASS